MHQLLRQQASRLVQRRQDDIKDESSEFSSLSSQSILKVFIFYLNGLIVPPPPVSFSCSDCSLYSYSSVHIETIGTKICPMCGCGSNGSRIDK